MITALVLSGGTGTRLGSRIPKQYLEVNDKPILVYCLEQLDRNENINNIQIVANPEWQDDIAYWLEAYDIKSKFVGFSLPGETRQLSIFNGLKDIKQFTSDADAVNDCVFIHDAARPLLSQDMINSCVEAIDGYDGVLPVLPMKDTVYLSEDGKTITSLLDRKQIFAGQAPEVFRLQAYYEANKKLIIYDGDEGKLEISKNSPIYSINGSTEPAVMAGLNIAMIEGDERNFKITTSEDLERFMTYEGMEA